MIEFQPTLLTRLADPIAGKIVAFGVGHEGNVYVAVAQEPVDYTREQPGWATFPKTRPDSPQSYRLLAYDGETADTILDLLIREEAFNIHFIQPLLDRLLLVCARSTWRSETDIEHNGRIYDRKGQLVGEIILGDGIEDIQVTASGRIWASYFDEGIFGNFGWRLPLGNPGLVAWDSAGEVTYRFEPQPPLESMADCYAMNCPSESDLWCCYYMSFPLVHIQHSHVVESWESPVGGAHAFAISDAGVLFQGGSKDRHTYKLCAFASDALSVTMSASFNTASGHQIKADRVVGRGGSLFLLEGREIYRVSVSDVAGAA